jgi:release factor glutamine methyltransferase
VGRRADTLAEIWTVLKILTWMTDFFAAKEIDNPRLEAQLLLAHSLDLERIGLYLQHDRPLTSADLDKIRPLVKRRGQREPLQYILGETEFWSLPFKVTPDVLIPRADTEILVEEALKKTRESGQLLDVGTGSGAIAVSLATELEDWQIDALDISSEALDIARDNAELNGVAQRIVFRQGTLAHLPTEKYDLIVSNPPYIAATEWAQLMPEVRDYEPELALVAADDGLECYRLLTDQAATSLSPNGWLLVEIGYQQAEAVQQLFRAAGLTEIFLRHDYAGQPRVVGGRYV